LLLEITSYNVDALHLCYTVAEYSWSIANNDPTRDFIVNNFVIGVYCRCVEILCQIAFSSIANYLDFIEKSNLV
jgi:hypothetical protein